MPRSSRGKVGSGKWLGKDAPVKPGQGEQWEVAGKEDARDKPGHGECQENEMEIEVNKEFNP